VVHNDLSPSNTLIDERDPERFAGLVDFGDMVETALAIDVAVGATAQFADGVDPVVAMTEFVAGFHEADPLTPTELDLLPDLVAARLCLDLVLPAWHRRVHPENPRYRRGSDTEAEYAADAARQRAILAAVRAPTAAEALRAACPPPSNGD
jgi:Ser/Thr protein kinase RdoA (MazF antagonist)